MLFSKNVLKHLLGAALPEPLAILLKVKFIPPFCATIIGCVRLCYRPRDNDLQFKTEMLDIYGNMYVITLRENKCLTYFCTLTISDKQ